MHRKISTGRTARPKATAAVAAGLLAGIAVSCYGGSAAAATTAPGSGTTASSAAHITSAKTLPRGLYKRPVPGRCYVWPGVGMLRAMVFPLEQAINGTDIYGYGSSQAISDDMAVNIAVMGLAKELHQLPADWGWTIFDWVITPANSEQPVQMSEAVSNAETLAGDISRLCYVP